MRVKRLYIGVIIILLTGILIYINNGNNEGIYKGNKSDFNQYDELYVSKDTSMYWGKGEETGIRYHLNKGEAIVLGGEEGDWGRVLYKGVDGWVKKEDITKNKKEVEYKVEVVHEREGENGVKTKNATEHNSKQEVDRIIRQHIELLESYGADMERYLNKYPLQIEIRDYKGGGSGGEYHYKEDGISKIVIYAYADHGTITGHILIHEFGHHIGYNVGHKGMDFKELSEFKDLSKEVMGNKWANDNREKYAEAHAEAYLVGYKNDSAAGNFTKEEDKNKFIQWEVKKINGE